MAARCSHLGRLAARAELVRRSPGARTTPRSSLRPAGGRSIFSSFTASNRRPDGTELIPRSVAGGGDGGNSGGASGGGDDGGDDDDDGAGGKKEGGFVWKGWEDRVNADPQFVYKVLVEQVIGVGASVIGDMASRPNWGLSELDFVFATLVVGSIVNFALMYLLAPTGAAGAAAGGGLIAKLFSEQTLISLGAPGGHMFQPGFAFGGRLVNLAYKGALFAMIGMAAGLVGTAISNGLLVLRKKLDPEFTSPNTPPNVLANASCWALHMGVSSNLRYQILNGLDMVVQPALPSGAFRLLTSVVRGVNNAAGGMSFVLLAKLLGVQKAAAPPPPPEPVGKGKKGKAK